MYKITNKLGLSHQGIIDTTYTIFLPVKNLETDVDPNCIKFNYIPSQPYSTIQVTCGSPVLIYI